MPPVCLLLLIALIGVPVLIGLSEPGDEVSGRGTVALTAGPTVLWLVSALAVCLAFIENLLK